MGSRTQGPSTHLSVWPPDNPLRTARYREARLARGVTTVTEEHPGPCEAASRSEGASTDPRADTRAVPHHVREASGPAAVPTWPDIDIVISSYEQ